ncbi:deaminase domain-containing protein [Paenibacillus helianthi]|nr:deaminase domain-containing protein [Paenibacillus helianthi]
MNDHLVQAQVLINELTVEAEKLEDVIRAALKGVEGLQEENKQKANQLTQWFSLFAGMFGSFRTQTFAGRYTIPTAAQKAAANLITSFAALGGRDELDSDPAVEKLRNTIQTSRLGTVENIAAQSKLKDIFAARDQIAKAQWAYKIYEEFGNKAQMNAVNRQAEEARQKLESMEVDKIHYEAGKDLSVYFKQPAVQACDYDPSITTQNVPLLQNEEYLLLLRLAMEKTPAGENAKSQLEAKRLEIEEAERQLALDAETGKKTYNFDEYTKTLWGNTWVLSKNGKTDREAAQASMAYNEAIKNGEIKSYQENVPVDYLTEQILAAKNGTNYWTGEKISKLQAYGIIVSSLITTFQGIESFRGSLKRNLPLHPGANEIPASRVKQPKVSVPEVTVPKPVEPVGKIAEGTGKGVRIGSRSVEESLEKINDIRQADNIGGKRNIAFAEYEINGSTGEIIGVSGKADRAGTAGVPNQRKFETITTPDGNPRTLDAEVKILEELASQLPNNASGKVHIFSELPFCESCSGVIKQFKEQFPNVEVIISHGPSKSR